MSLTLTYEHASTDALTLDGIFRRLAEIDANLIADVGLLEPGWSLASDLMQADSPLLDRALDAQAKDHPQMDARTKASYFFGRYTWYVLAPMIAAHLMDEGLPRFAPGAVALQEQTYTWHYGEASGEATRVAVRFLGENGTTSNRDALRTAIESHLTPLIEQIYVRTRLSRHALWCIAADSIANHFLTFGRALGDVRAAQREAVALIHAPCSPMQRAKTHYVDVQVGEHCEPFVARGGCCRYFTVSASGDDYCGTCVHRTPEDRVARWTAYLAKKYAGEAVA